MTAHRWMLVATLEEPGMRTRIWRCLDCPARIEFDEPMTPGPQESGEAVLPEFADPRDVRWMRKRQDLSGYHVDQRWQREAYGP